MPLCFKSFLINYCLKTKLYRHKIFGRACTSCSLEGWKTSEGSVTILRSCEFQASNPAKQNVLALDCGWCGSPQPQRRPNVAMLSKGKDWVFGGAMALSSRSPPLKPPERVVLTAPVPRAVLASEFSPMPVSNPQCHWRGFECVIRLSTAAIVSCGAAALHSRLRGE